MLAKILTFPAVSWLSWRGMATTLEGDLGVSFRQRVSSPWDQKHLPAKLLKLVPDGCWSSMRPSWYLPMLGRWTVVFEHKSSKHYCNFLLCPGWAGVILSKSASSLCLSLRISLKWYFKLQSWNKQLDVLSVPPIHPHSSLHCPAPCAPGPTSQKPSLAATCLHAASRLSDEEVKCVISESLGLICPFHLFWHDLMFQNL